ncbi:hypothetical protein E3N88_18022 [Mikania micrantha]|uniref:Uncharacterized protein n=1 Tax=Mikania micrantha TaxID=192012 RepID=A0A5N6NTP1_9ASTR|nr:hypothetical protein E3N88_18022 [Mikania micrantha]
MQGSWILGFVDQGLAKEQGIGSAMVPALRFVPSLGFGWDNGNRFVEWVAGFVAVPPQVRCRFYPVSTGSVQGSAREDARFGCLMLGSLRVRPHHEGKYSKSLYFRDLRFEMNVLTLRELESD